VQISNFVLSGCSYSAKLVLRLEQLFKNTNAFVQEMPCSVPLLCDRLGRGGWRRGMQPSSEPLPYEFENCASIFENRFQPGEAAHLRKINSPETEASDKNVDAITQRLVVQESTAFSIASGL